jgi:carbon-monoxide dehydrogenase large subunit
MRDMHGAASEPEGRAIGKSQLRAEDARLLTGRGRYVADLRLPRMVHAVFVRSPHAHAQVRSIDATRATQLPGVVAVITASDLPEVRLAHINEVPGLIKTPQPVLAGDRVRFVGQAVAVVVAQDRYIAEDALELIDVDYEELPAVVSVDAARPEGHLPLLAEVPDDVVYRDHRVFGDPAGAFETAARVFASTYRASRFVAAPLECRGCVASFEPASRTLSIWSSTQSPHLLRRRLALTTGLPEHRVRVMMPDVGGGFGQKIAISPEEVAVAFASTRLGVAVKWIEDRRENLMAAPHAKEQVIHLELAVADDGAFLGLRARIVGDVGAYSYNSASALIEPFMAAKLLPGVYRLDNYEYEVQAVLTNKSPTAPYRGVGWTAAQAAREILIDEAARGLGMDPVGLRLQNMIGSQELPRMSAPGLLYDSGSFQESVQLAAQMVGYEDFRVEQGRARPEGRYLGVGFSPYVEPAGWGTEGMNQIGLHSFPSNDSARVSMDASGKVTVSVGTVAIGQGHDTVIAQIAADVLGVDFEDVTVLFADTSSVPISLAGTRASRSTVVGGGAVGLAAEDLRKKLLGIAGLMLEVDPQALEIAAGRVQAPGTPATSISVREVAEAAFYNIGIREAEPEPNLTCTRLHDPRATCSNGCIAAVVEVDAETGAIKVRRLIGVEDCGTVINPMLVEGQLAGGLAQGLGGALLERIVYDEHGQIVTTTLMDYLIPTATDMPNVEIAHLSSPSPNTWLGIKGMAEAGMVGGPAAIANAVADALAPFRARVGSLPLSAEAVVRMIAAASQSV